MFGSAILDGEISALQSELGVLSKRQLQMDTMRADERKIFEKVKGDLEYGVSGMQKHSTLVETVTELHSSNSWCT